MPNSHRPRTQLVSREGQHYVLVPPRWAADLRAFLQGKGLSAGYPEEVNAGLCSVALRQKFDAAAVQGLLDDWAG